MRIDTVGRASLIALLALLVMAGMLSESAFAAPPTVKTVPWVSSNTLIPHDTFAGKAIRLKGTSDVQGATIQYAWDFGDGSPVATGTVSNMYVIEASHVYAGAVGTVWTARLTVQNTATGETGNKAYYVEMRAKNLSSEVNVAIDEGLWYLHKTQTRTTCSSVPCGYWSSGYAANSRPSNGAANLNAFEVNGHLETGDPNNPYTETVARAMHWVLTQISSANTSTQFNPLAPGGFNPDANGNGLYLWINSGSYQFYETGPVMDAIVASGTPDMIAPVGGANIIGRKYKDIVQDMVDAHSLCQYDTSPVGGGWYYSCNGYGDNSISQWAAIGILAANRVWGRVVPQVVKDYNLVWLTYSQEPTNGYFGYQSNSPLWGPYATTPSGMVQLAMDGVGRGNARWDKAETYIRDRFGNTGGYSNAIRDYYYGLFSFVKSMLLHDSNADGVAEPIQLLRSSTPGVLPIDWYAAQTAAFGGTDAIDGVARTLVNDQDTSGYWWSHNASGDQYPYETAWAIMMLSRTLFEAGAPVAVAEAMPNPGVVGQVIQFNGGSSFHQDPARNIVKWEWDLNNDGTYETLGVNASRNFGSLGDFVVGLKVTDDNVPVKTATTTVTVRITTPPIAPTANAGGPYNFCIGALLPFFLDGTGSTNPDQGQSEPGKPADVITSYLWDLDGDAQFDDATGAQPNVTAIFNAPGSRLIQLKVTDNTALSFPSSGMGNLSDTDSAQVTVRASTDPACSCVSNLTATPKPTKADLKWTWAPGVHHYNVYRGTASGGPYLKIGQSNAPGLPNTGVYADSGLTNNVTYYWVVRAAQANGTETCQSNQASAKPVAR